MPNAWQSFDSFVAERDTEPVVDSERYVSYRLEDLWPEWQKDARCQGVGLHYYFGDETAQTTMKINDVRAASKVCDACPVFDDCLRWSLENHEEYGVWAGTSGRVRRKILALVDAGHVTVDDVMRLYGDGRRDFWRGFRAGGDRLDAGHDLRGEASG